MYQINDSANLSFVERQTSHIEAGVYRTRYPDIQYPFLVPVDTSANPWATSVTYYSMDGVGRAEWISGRASDIPVVGLDQSKHETPVYMAGIGYDYGLEEINQARMLGMNLPNEKAMVAKRAYEEMVDRVALLGDTEKGFNGLFNYPGITAGAVATGSGGVTWALKTADEILIDVNAQLISTHDATNTTSVADTLILPWSRMQAIASRRLGDTGMTILEFLRANNVYTAMTNQPLTIRAAYGLNTAGSGGTARMIAYRRSPEVLKLHIPLPHQFLPVRVNGLTYQIPGIFRLGGLDIRLPKEVKYADGL